MKKTFTYICLLMLTMVSATAQDVPVTLPADVEPQTWINFGHFHNDEVDKSIYHATQIAFNGTDVYLQGLSFNYPESWVKGTYDSASGSITIPSGQYAGEDGSGKTFIVGSDEDGTICDIEFSYDEEAKKMEQSTKYIFDNNGSTTEINSCCYWTDCIYVGAYKLVTPPEGVEPQTWTIYGHSHNDEVDMPINHVTQIAFNGTDVYLQGLSFHFPEAWVRGTYDSASGSITIPSWQYAGEDDSGKTFILGCDENGKICHIKFHYDEVEQKLTQSTKYILENNGSTTDINSCSYWTGCIYLEGVYELVTPPEGVEPQSWTIYGYFHNAEVDISTYHATQIAFNGTDVYLQGLSFYFPEAWVKGTYDSSLNRITIPSGQYAGVDVDGKTFIVGSDENDNICDIEFYYYEEIQRMEQITQYIYENNGSTTELIPWSCWTNCCYIEGVYELVTPPVGVEPQTWTLEGCLSINGPISNEQRETQVAFDGTDVYVAGLPRWFPNSWIKGTLNTETGLVTFPYGQFVGFGKPDNYFMVGSDDDITVCDIVYYYDDEAKKLTQVTKNIYDSTKPDNFDIYNGKWLYSHYIIGEAVVVNPVEVPAGLETEAYSFTAMDDGTESLTYQTMVGFDGKDVYFKCFSGTTLDLWAKGTLSDDGKTVTIPAGQFMGTYYHGFDFDYYIAAVDGEGNMVDLVLNYDAENATFTTSQTMVFNANGWVLDPIDIFTDVVIAKIVNKSVIPDDPSFDNISFWGLYPRLYLDIPDVDTEGNSLIIDKLYYSIWFEKDGVRQLFTVLASEYEYVDEDMTEIPYTYDDDWDIYRGGHPIYLNPTDYDYESWTNIGVQSIYYGGEERTTSKIFWDNSIWKTITDAGWATICSNMVLDFTPSPGVATDEDIKAYIVTGVADDGKTLMLRQVTGKVAPNTGLLLGGDATHKLSKGTYYIPAYSSQTQQGEVFSDNKLIGVLEDTKVDAGTFVLLNEDKGVGFYKTINDFTVTGRTAYLPADVVGSDVKGLRIAFDTPTGIESVENSNDLRFDSGVWYDLSGRRIKGKPNVPGIYIVNGKKVTIK